MARVLDNAQRMQALMPRGSFIVQAPAGSGKTGLLIQRYLALLPSVHEPEEILAITFTRKAANEMRHRVLGALAAARDGAPAPSSYERFTRELAERALLHDRERGWNLLENSSRIQARTVDAFCASVVRTHPFESGLGGQPEPVDDARFLFEEAVSRRVQQGGAELETVLWHLDNDVRTLRELLVQMLVARDQWSRPLADLVGVGPRPASTSPGPVREDVEQDLRARLESTLRGEVERALQVLSDSTPRFVREVAPPLLAYSASQLEQAPPTGWPGASLEDLPVWEMISERFLKKDGDLRSRVDRRQGFPAGTPERKARKAEMLELLGELIAPEHEPFRVALGALGKLPPPRYTGEQWHVTRALLRLLKSLLREVREVFGRRRMVDHTEVASAALRVLRARRGPLQHLLVDEFQDTSTTQYQLIESLIRGWEPGDGRTVLLVGDPMQSIYRFREAEVGLYLRCWRQGIGDLRPGALQLQTNFRSAPEVIDRVNRIFERVMPESESAEEGAVPYARFEAGLDAAGSPPEEGGAPAHGKDGVHAHCWHEDPGGQEGERVEAIVRAAQAEGLDSVAIIGRYRHHLTRCLTHLREKGVRYRAVELDRLSDRPGVQDLRALTEVLVAPASRLAWLVLLRGPWGGLSLAELLVLLGNDERPVPEIWVELDRMKRLPEAARSRVERVRRAWETWYSRRGRRSLRRTVEGLWLALGGPAVGGEATAEDATLYLDLLESVEQGGDLPAGRLFDRRLQEDFARPDPRADGWLEAMTIHKAKGLEFDCVIVPGLGRVQTRDDSRLLLWQERFVEDRTDDVRLLLAPIRSKRHTARDRIYDYVSRGEGTKSKHELQRLLYVACTRARRRLHLLGHLIGGADGPKPAPGSALEVLAPGALADFVNAAGPPPEPTEERREVGAPRIERQRLRRAWPVPTPAPDAGDIPPWVERASAPPPSRGMAPPRPTPGESDEVASEGGSTESLPIAPEGAEGTAGSARAVGVVLHRLLERLVRPGTPGGAEHERDGWGEGWRAELTPGVRVALHEEGVPSPAVDEASREVLDLLERMREDEKGRWLLESHPDGDAELEITGVVAGEVRNARVDRTFVVDGERWIVDYKTSARRADATASDGREALEAFRVREVEEHRPQLEAYQELMAHAGESAPIHAALYFVRYAWLVEVS